MDTSPEKSTFHHSTLDSCYCKNFTMRCAWGETGPGGGKFPLLFVQRFEKLSHLKFAERERERETGQKHSKQDGERDEFKTLQGIKRK